MAVADCIRACRHCGKGFIRTSKGQPTKYCTHECRLDAKRAKGRQRQRTKWQGGECSVCGKAEMARGLCPAHYFRMLSKGSLLNRCAICGMEHDGRGYCSAGCRVAALGVTKSLRRIAVAAGDRIDRIRVFERDGWRCHICGHKTLRSMLGKNHDRAPQLDHIVTLADGGTHTWGNVACACAQCNWSKGSRSLGQLGLSLPM